MLRDGGTYTNPFQEGSLQFSGRKGGRTLDERSLDVTSTTTVQDLLDFWESALGIQDSPDIPGTSGGSITADGRLELVGNRGVENAIDISISDMTLTTTGGDADTINLGFNSSEEATGESAVTDFVVFDSLGIPLNVRLTTVLEARDSTSTTYRWYADSEDNDPETGASISVGTGTVVFDGEGNVSGINNSTVSIDRRNVSSSSPLEFELDFSQVSGLAANEASVAASRQDGSAAGKLSSFLIGEDGTIRGIFSNGVTRDLGQIRLGRFANNTGLEQRGENLFASGVNSGLAIEDNPGEQGIGSIVAGAVELSNTDMGRNLIELILASTQYRGNTRVITAAQQLLDEVLNLRR